MVWRVMNLRKVSYCSFVSSHTMVQEQMTGSTPVSDGRPSMAVMVGVVGALSAFYHDSTDIKDPVHARSRATA